MSPFLKRWWWVLLVVAVGLGLWRLRFDVDILNLLPPDEPTVQGLKLYEKHFANARELVVTLRAPDAERAERLAGELAARLKQQTNLVETVTWQSPFLEHPEQLGELLGWLWLSQPPADFAALTNRLAPEQLKATLAETKEILTMSMSPMDVARRAFDPFNFLSMPSVTNLSGMWSGQTDMFSSTNGEFRLLFVQSAVDLAGYRACESWMRSIRQIEAGLRASQPSEWQEVAVHYTGRPVFVVEIATSMQRDMSGSVVGTSLIIAVLFWLTHRRWLPMLWLLTLLLLVLVATVALGGLVLGSISVVSMGFAAVLLGLAVDYAVVHYQEALAHPHLTVPEVRRAIAPSILWAAITTVSAFLVLNLGGLPGLGQLGTLVALGVALAALVMVMIYLPPLFPGRRKPPAGYVPPRWWTYFLPQEGGREAGAGKQAMEVRLPLTPALSLREREDGRLAQAHSLRAPWLVTGLILAAAGIVLCIHLPGLDKSGNALKPQRAEAETTLDEVKAEILGMQQDVLWLIVSGRNETEVYERLQLSEKTLNTAAASHTISKPELPTALWPRPDHQAANRVAAAVLSQQGPLLRKTALDAGFTTNALVLTDELLRTWARARASTDVLWPTNGLAQWLLGHFRARRPEGWLVMGTVSPPTNHAANAALAELSSELARHQVFLSGWDLLGSTTLKRVQAKLWQLVTPMVVLVLASLWFAFRRPIEILLGGAVLLLSGVFLLALMAIAGWSWNLLNLMGLPLILGTGVDYTIFIQLALRRHRGDLAIVRRSVGRALMLCGATAMAGFGSLALSSNPGMASLGRVCAVGIGANMLFSVFLLPAWWTFLSPKSKQSTVHSPQSTVHTLQPTGSLQSSIQQPAASTQHPVDTQHPTRKSSPSSFYRTRLWRLGLGLASVCPPSLAKAVCTVVAELYYRLQRKRREVVVRNFLPAFGGERSAAEAAAHRLHRKFAGKLVDLWRVESGAPVENWLTNPPELEIIRAARQRGQGTLFITLHLGNWEHGGLLLKQLGIRLTVLTLAEPDDGLTELRTDMRRRLGVETLLIGQDSFAFIDVIKKLQAGGDLAIALDRPPPKGGMAVQFFGQTFEASLAAAELARASGCALIGVTIVRRQAGYAVKVLPEFTYDRRALGSRDARRDLTQQILRAFEPEIRKDIDQWYQFVPIWPQGR